MKLQNRERTVKVARIASYDKGLPGITIATQGRDCCSAVLASRAVHRLQWTRNKAFIIL